MIIDDHLVVREGLDAMLASAPVIVSLATAGNAKEALEVCESFAPNVVLLDVRMPGSDGYHVLDQIHRRWPAIRVIMFSSSATTAEIQLARQRGASGYLSKSAGRDALLAAILEVASGSTHFISGSGSAASGSVGSGAVGMGSTGSGSVNAGSAAINLSPRELEVLLHLGRGLSNDELGRAIGISGETIKSHLKSIFQKLGVSGRSEAVARGYDLGILNIPL